MFADNYRQDSSPLKLGGGDILLHDLCGGFYGGLVGLQNDARREYAERTPVVQWSRADPEELLHLAPELHSGVNKLDRRQFAKYVCRLVRGEPDADRRLEAQREALRAGRFEAGSTVLVLDETEQASASAVAA